ncbi:MAG: EAL domain-containing protein, partial [Elusimicrobia bacterium]|nr:EAL domain-containing protein [Elusimicrobiota bacterium]
SLSYLHRFPVDTLKIDQSFIRNIDSDAGDRAVVNAIISLGESLGLRIVAEGVETERQAECLRGRGGRVDMALQGFHFCRPQRPDAIEIFLRERATPSAA